MKIQKKRRNKEGKRGEIPKFNFPEKIELFLALSLAFLLFLFDVVQNKVLDLGTDYRVSFFSEYSAKASSFLWIAFILLVIFQLILLYRNIWYKSKKRYFDYAFALLLSIANTLLIIGFVSSINAGGHVPVEYFFNMIPVNIYHLGIALEILSIFYFAFTK